MLAQTGHSFYPIRGKNTINVDVSRDACPGKDSSCLGNMQNLPYTVLREIVHYLPSLHSPYTPHYPPSRPLGSHLVVVVSMSRPDQASRVPCRQAKKLRTHVTLTHSEATHNFHRTPTQLYWGKYHLPRPGKLTQLIQDLFTNPHSKFTFIRTEVRARNTSIMDAGQKKKG